MILEIEEFRSGDLIITPKATYEVVINFNEYGMYEINDKTLGINVLHSNNHKIIDWYYHELKIMWSKALNNVPYAKNKMYKYFKSIDGV